jgi:hypothetical protein
LLLQLRLARGSQHACQGRRLQQSGRRPRRFVGLHDLRRRAGGDGRGGGLGRRLKGLLRLLRLLDCRKRL